MLLVPIALGALAAVIVAAAIAVNDLGWQSMRSQFNLNNQKHKKRVGNCQ